MNSIDQNQPETNKESLSGKAAAQKIKELAEKAQTCFFCTEKLGEDRKGTRPMSVQKVDEDGTMWFLSPNDSFTNAEIEVDPQVKLFFQGSPHSDFMMIEGNAYASTDPSKIKELWQPVLKTWFTEGESDPRISVIRVDPKSGYYWDTKHGTMVAGIKMLIGAISGKTLDDSIQGDLKL